ncbi:hemerythrin HHE cation binding domain-containing protein [Cadophora sp. MPI-SDFR-AT-0126]|nr:hemerythrin HHE cation binding domain-containing protein [Leotiomycetes sp. MPI-SDFR-AT-0126]
MSTITDAIKNDHREIKEYAENIRKATDNDSKTRWQNQFTWELARHSIAEELVVYPSFAKHLGAKGQAMADKDRDEHQSVKDALYKFQNLTPENPEFLPTLEALMKDLNQHIQEEENKDLPELESSLQTDESESMARSFGRTKAFVPSRSHPSAPNKPPFETVIGLMTAPIDHLGDIFRKFPDETISPNPSTK